MLSDNFLARISKVHNRDHNRAFQFNPNWKPIVEIQVRNNILEGKHKIKYIPVETSFNENRKHQAIKLPRTS